MIRYAETYHWLHMLLTVEYRREFARQALRQSRQPITMFRIHTPLREYMRIK